MRRARSKTTRLTKLEAPDSAPSAEMRAETVSAANEAAAMAAGISLSVGAGLLRRIPLLRRAKSARHSAKTRRISSLS